MTERRLAVLVVAILGLSAGAGVAGGPQDGITLQIDHDPGAPDLLLGWSGGQPTYSVFRSLTPNAVAAPENAIGNTPASSWSDPVPPGRLLYYIVTAPPLPSCMAMRAANPGASLPDDVYLIDPGGGPLQTYCDMTTDGGGWTALFAGKNGSTNAFDHFDTGYYLGTFLDPKLQYLQRAPSWVGDSATEAAVECGSAMVSVAMTNSVRNWLVAGAQAGWTAVTPRTIRGIVPNLPNSLWTGSPGTPSFIFSKNQAAFANTFASTYSSAAYDYCNGAFDTTSTLRVFYRESLPAPAQNAPSPPRASCGAILEAGESTGDGAYWLTEPGEPTYLAYCDMTTDGGGWTAMFAGRNGSPNVFDRFDGPLYAGVCTDPATRCLRRAPPSAGDTSGELAVSCGGAMVRFPLTTPARAWLFAGTPSDWAALTPTVVAGTVAQPPNTLWTGNAATPSFTFAKDQSAGGLTFASSSTASSFDYCNGAADQTSLVRVFHREAPSTPVLNDPGMARESCKAILMAAEAFGDGAYWLREPGGSPYLAYCDMTTDGGGWTAVYAGRNGSVNAFDHFDAGAYDEICTDPATRCVRRPAPTLAGTSTELAVACGGGMVSYPLTPAIRSWLESGTQSGWASVTPTVLEGVVSQVPNWIWTGSGGSLSFIFSRNQGAFANTFASTYASASYDYCNGAFDRQSFVGVFLR